MIFNFSSVPNFEENVAKLQDKEGWITMSNYKKYAVENTELCKNEFIDRIFLKPKVKEDQYQKKIEATVRRRSASQDPSGSVRVTYEYCMHSVTNSLSDKVLLLPNIIPQ